MAIELLLDEAIDLLNIKHVQRLIKTARAVHGITQKELGAMVGVSAAQISKIENRYTNITLGTLLEIFHALGIQATVTATLNKTQQNNGHKTESGETTEVNRSSP